MDLKPDRNVSPEYFRESCGRFSFREICSIVSICSICVEFVTNAQFFSSHKTCFGEPLFKWLVNIATVSLANDCFVPKWMVVDVLLLKQKKRRKSANISNDFSLKHNVEGEMSTYVSGFSKAGSVIFKHSSYLARVLTRYRWNDFTVPVLHRLSM